MQAMTFLYILAAVALFGILITVHEAGHFFAARLLRIPVREFAIGFGPKLLAWKSKKHETDFFLRAIPLGGYCAFYGEDDAQGEYKNDPRAFGKFPVWKRLISIVMGPAMNIAAAFLAAVLLFAIVGIPVAAGPFTTQIQEVTSGGAAQAAGLLPGDVILSVDGEPVTDNLSQLLNPPDATVAAERAVTVLRGEGEELTLHVTPVYDTAAGRSMIGIVMTITQPVENARGSVPDVFRHAADLSYSAGRMVFDAIRGLVTRGEGIQEVSGVVGITKLIVDEISRTQLEGYLYLMVIISINLGLMNLLIIPGLDGSRIVFLLIEAARGKPIKREAYVHLAGMALLFALMAFITLRDITRLF